MALIDPITPQHDHGLGADLPPAVPEIEQRPGRILDPGFDLTLRPMRYPGRAQKRPAPPRAQTRSRRQTEG